MDGLSDFWSSILSELAVSQLFTLNLTEFFREYSLQNIHVYIEKRILTVYKLDFLKTEKLNASAGEEFTNRSLVSILNRSSNE
jgi:hypothetical protein